MTPIKSAVLVSYQFRLKILDLEAYPKSIRGEEDEAAEDELFDVDVVDGWLWAKWLDRFMDHLGQGMRPSFFGVLARQGTLDLCGAAPSGSGE